MIRFIIAALLCASAGMAAEPVFFWDMETENATVYKPGSDNTPTYTQAFRSDAHAYEGSWALDCGATWGSATFDNNSNEVVWAPVTEGTVVFYWQYHAPWGDLMLFQMTGKSSTKDPLYDTNDGVGLRTRGQNPGEFFSGTARNLYHGIDLVEGRWYRFAVRYKHDRGISLQIDDSPEYTSTETAFGPTECVAWHQILIGNDRSSTGMHQNIDNFAVYDHWLGEEPTSYVPAAYLRQNNRLFTVVAGPNPMRDVIMFDAGNALTKSITVFNGAGDAVWNSDASSSQSVQWNGGGAPAGAYFYRVETVDGIQTGSFMKINK